MSLRQGWTFLILSFPIFVFAFVWDFDHGFNDLSEGAAKTARQSSAALVLAPQAHQPLRTSSTAEGAQDFTAAPFPRSAVSQQDRRCDVYYGSLALPQLSAATETQCSLLLQSTVANRNGPHVHPSASAESRTGREVCPELGATRTNHGGSHGEAIRQDKGFNHRANGRTSPRAPTPREAKSRGRGKGHGQGPPVQKGKGKAEVPAPLPPPPMPWPGYAPMGPDDEPGYDDAYAIDASNGHAKYQCCCAAYASASRNTSWTNHDARTAGAREEDARIDDLPEEAWARSSQGRQSEGPRDCKEGWSTGKPRFRISCKSAWTCQGRARSSLASKNEFGGIMENLFNRCRQHMERVCQLVFRHKKPNIRSESKQLRRHSLLQRPRSTTQKLLWEM